MATNPRPSNIDRSLIQAPDDTFSGLEDSLLEKEADFLELTVEPSEEGGAEVVFGESTN